MLTRQKVRGRLRFWQRRLGLTDYKIRVRFDRPAEKHTAHCDLWPDKDPTYHVGEIYFNLAKIDPKELDALCIHELCHIAWWPLGQLAMDWATNRRMRRTVERVEEQSTTRLERVLLHAFGLAKQDAA